MVETNRLCVPAAEEILGKYWPVLDHGFVALVDYMGGDDAIERAARTSYQYAGRARREQRGLLRYMRRNQHTSPTEMAEVALHCSMPIFVARQWVRTRTASLNEVSGRYSLLPMVFYTPAAPQFATQSTTNKQGRGAALDAATYEAAVRRWNEDRAAARALYEDLAEDGVAREVARIGLPLSTYTQWYWKIDLHNAMRFLSQRCDLHAQWETRQYANVIAGMVKRLAPASFDAWLDYEFLGARMSRMELASLRRMLAGESLETAAASQGLADRELGEFRAKLADPAPLPTFDLDLEAARPGAYFEERYRAALPTVDRGAK